MDAGDAIDAVPPEVVAYYEAADERSRLDTGLGLVERERTRRLIRGRLPPPPGVVVDVGCGAGVHALWLAEAGYEVHVSDPVPRHVEEARTAAAATGVAFASAAIGHAADLARDNRSADAVLMLGPLYHLPERQGRLAAMEEAVRVLRPGGWFFGAAISRFTSLVNAMREELLDDPAFHDIVMGDLGTGRHRNTSANPAYFTTAFVHRPDGFAAELHTAGFVEVDVVAVEGLAWALDDVASVWADEGRRERLLALLETTEREPSILGASTHLLGIGRRPEDP